MFGAPIPHEVEVRWVDGDGQGRTTKLKVEEAVRRQLTGDWTLYCIFEKDGTVQLRALKEDDQAGLDELTKGL
jgi:hypothetical protein